MQREGSLDYSNYKSAKFAAGEWFLCGVFYKNLLPVTLGNLAGGALTGSFMWLGHVWEQKK